ncbi:MAG: 3-hydroxyacyl-CoA dehydrogenase [Thermoleophilia bacterium]|nr:3-hydroxyacyl-CoA dehydrogenase [Thermoleophilia bacterium]
MATDPAEITRIGIVGGGTMGAEIAHVAAAAGIAVLITDADPTRAVAGRDRALAVAARRVERGRMSAADADAAAARIRAVPSIAHLSEVDAVIEAVPEDLALKIRVHAQIDATVRPDVVVATNTSGLSVTALGAATTHPGRLIGLHFFNPASTMRLVEVIAGTATDEATVTRALALVLALGKTPVRVGECPGFVVNRVLVRAMAEAYRSSVVVAIDRHVADRAVTDGGPSPIGPFALGDLVGLDVLESIRSHLEAAYGDRFVDGGTLAPLVADGRLGRKSGSGLTPPAEGAPTGAEPMIAALYYAAALDEARRLADEGVATASDIDLAMCLGAGWESGPLAGI